MTATVLIDIEALLAHCIHTEAEVLQVSPVHMGRKTLRLTGGAGVEVLAGFPAKPGDKITVYISDGMPGPVVPSRGECIAYIKNKKTQDGAIPL